MRRPSDHEAVLLVANQSAQLGGSELLLLQFLPRLRKFRPVVLLGEEGPLEKRLLEHGISYQVLPLPPAISTLGRHGVRANLSSLARMGPSTLRYAEQVARTARQLGAALIQASSYKAYLYAGLAGRLARKPVVWHVQMDLSDQTYPPLARRIIGRLSNVLADRAICTSEATRRALVEAGGSMRRTTVIPNGIDVAWWDLPVTSEPFTQAGLVIGMVGRISPLKGQREFVQAAAKIASAYPSAEFWVVGGALFGERQYEEEVHNLAAALGLKDRLRWWGNVTNVPEVMAQMDVVVVCSTQPEGFGLVAVEAMALGKPVVASAHGGLMEIVENGVTGRLIPPRNVDALVEAISWLIEHPSSAQGMGQQGRVKARQHFDIRQMAKSFEREYEKVIQ